MSAQDGRLLGLDSKKQDQAHGAEAGSYHANDRVLLYGYWISGSCCGLDVYAGAHTVQKQQQSYKRRATRYRLEIRFGTPSVERRSIP